jgi:hypothetical protein
MSDYYAPNQQVVRADASGPAEEGTGGPAVLPTPSPEPEQELEELTKDELLELAKSRGISPANATMSKAELLEALGG